MTYDFTTRLDRRGVGAEKWDAMLRDDANVPADVVPLSIADMEFRVAPPILEALRAYVSDEVMGYTSPTEEFVEACLGWQRRRHDWEPKSEWATLSPGVVPAIFNAVRAFTEPVEGVVIQTPVYYPFRLAIQKNGRRVVTNPLVERDGRWEMDFEGLERACAEPDVRLLVLCSPHNPVGRVWEKDELRRLVDICLAHDVTIVSDEIHDDLVMPGHTHTTLLNVMEPAEWEHAVICTAPSKTFNLAGCQCSVIYIPGEDLRTRYLRAAEETAAIGGMLNTFAYPACIAAYTQCDEWLDELLQVIDANAKHVSTRLSSELPGVKVADLEGTYLLWADFRSWGLPTDELATFMKEEAHLYLDDGILFGDEGAGFERINLAAPASVLDEAIDRLVAAARARGLA